MIRSSLAVCLASSSSFSPQPSTSLDLRPPLTCDIPTPSYREGQQQVELTWFSSRSHICCGAGVLSSGALLKGDPQAGKMNVHREPVIQ